MVKKEADLDDVMNALLELKELLIKGFDQLDTILKEK